MPQPCNGGGGAQVAETQAVDGPGVATPGMEHTVSSNPTSPAVKVVSDGNWARQSVSEIVPPDDTTMARLACVAHPGGAC